MKLSVPESRGFIHDFWETRILPALMAYIRIPNQSPAFDPAWETNGYMDQAVRLAHEWCVRHGPEDMSAEIISSEHRTPVLLLEIPARGAPEQSRGAVLLYGHLDKQPPLEEGVWRKGLGPRSPVREGDRLYGRGGVDDGYAVFTSLAALLLLREQGLAHPRCLVLIECSEESGSPDLGYYVERLRERIGEPELAICLDSSCGSYDRLWLTTSLRGMIGGVLTVSVLEEGVHSGDAGGIVPSSFRIARALLERIEDQNTGQIRPEFQVAIPGQCIEEAGITADALGPDPFSRFPLVPGMKITVEDVSAGLIERTWKPALEVIGAEGFPGVRVAGNVLRPQTTLKLSLRVPPALDTGKASKTLKRIMESHPPYGARVTYREEWNFGGWRAPALAPWLHAAVQESSGAFFGKSAVCYGEGFSIPFMATLADSFPDAQFVVTGAMGPHANAHGPNEFLHVEMAKKITLCIAEILARS
ncbi:MAG: Acetylornithine deacetylase/Succinyl-diaminopimelate desuccinylase [Candidatus Kentron sp. G]|nr:MAG: Acetylornithine deacetylase/Succinyl-diaminopimelate desuccinylase [Candidatus Kentron sp. G]VFM97309.1 MAG: Acetylornithine deacetylase/Succinyl-diaminopimelate desuccinylase [Candidatus Kentron sp. G]